MAEHAHAAEHHAHPNYVKIWGILVALLAVSVAGPMFGHKLVTLITAFGIAGVKAYLVAKNFMHINVEKRFIPYLVITMLVFMLLFFAGVSPDVMKKEGRQWEKPSWKTSPAASTASAHEAHH
ncbi:MAG TPA: cytochrome C oxidase subunit IV family protein [Myxococcota bacterium]|jgi:caa(3)-type oxidase subunit IV